MGAIVDEAGWCRHTGKILDGRLQAFRAKKIMPNYFPSRAIEVLLPCYPLKHQQVVAGEPQKAVVALTL
jgi:hypothetical protein